MTKDEQAISEMVSQLEAAWNAGDSIKWVWYFKDDANFIHIFGGQLDGRVAIEASHREIFDTVYKGSHNKYTVQAIRLVRPDVAIAFIRAHLEFYEGGQSREIHARPTMVVVKDNGRWQVVAFQNTKVSELPGAMKISSQQT